MRHDIIADTMFVLNNADVHGKKECIVPASNRIKNMLDVIKKEKYIGEIERIEDGKQGMFKIQMLGKINKSRCIKPNFSVKCGDFEKWEKRYLPSRNMGVMIITTTKGLMTHKKARDSDIGGRLLAYIY